MKKSIVLLSLLTVCVVNPMAMAASLSDGLVHNFANTDNEFEYYYLDETDDAVNLGTQINILPGGAIWGATAYNNSSVNMMGGTVYSMKYHNYSSGNISGGTCDFTIHTNDYSALTISDGNLGLVGAHGNSSVTISGGRFAENFYAEEHSNVNITGGIFEKYISADFDSIVTLSGGSVEQLTVARNGIIYLDGTNFEISRLGVKTKLSYGDRLRNFGEVLYLSGELADGSMLDGTYCNVGRKSSGTFDIIIIPEPCTLLLLGIGAVVMRRRK